MAADRWFNWFFSPSSCRGQAAKSRSLEKLIFKWILKALLILLWSKLLQCSGGLRWVTKIFARDPNQITFSFSWEFQATTVSLSVSVWCVLLCHRPLACLPSMHSQSCLSLFARCFFSATLFSSALCFALSFFRIYHTTPFHNSIQFLFRRETTRSSTFSRPES